MSFGTNALICFMALFQSAEQLVNPESQLPQPPRASVYSGNSGMRRMYRTYRIPQRIASPSEPQDALKHHFTTTFGSPLQV
ncbi:unnamed protein product [Gongylonema pulchrum]|uniref:Secreted protein n=1 Tax=Gongylonema pulchrum TaxID=637853 RepID=A0A183CVE8_9BILA|nr:unnamed protein product [Gongylonema pulchrum]